MTILGIDLAGGGADKSVCAVREDWVVHPLIVWSKSDLMETTGKIVSLIAQKKPSKVIIDADGLGAGVFNRLRELQCEGVINQSITLIPFHGKYRCERNDISGELEFANWRSYAWWRMRELLAPSSDVTLAIPRHDDLIGEMCAPKWKQTSSGKIQVEPKEEIKKRLDRSTDHADAVIMAFCDLDYSEFEESWRVYDEGQATDMARRGVAPERPPEEEQAIEKVLWQQGQEIDLFGLF